jgi:hypothetical protein
MGYEHPNTCNKRFLNIVETTYSNVITSCQSIAYNNYQMITLSKHTLKVAGCTNAKGALTI